MESIDKFIEESIPLIEDYRPTYSLGSGVYDYGRHEYIKYDLYNEFGDVGDGSGEGDGDSETIDNGRYIANIKF